MPKRHILIPLTRLRTAPAEDTPDQAARESLEKLLGSNLARCLQLLFGVMLPHRNQEWGASAVSL